MNKVSHKQDAKQDRISWEVARGSEIVPGRRVLKRLGGGSRYEAYLVSGAEPEDADVRYVVKVLRPDKVTNAVCLRSLRREHSLLARLYHPAVPRPIAFDDAGARPHLVMTYIEGNRLSTRIRKQGPLPIGEVVNIAIALCSALAHLHERDVLHLDVKPGNVIDGPTTGLIDLSVARSTSDAATLKHHVGTDAYMAPEACVPQRFGGVTSAADVWGLGATLYRAATGELPFTKGTRETDSPEERWPALIASPGPFPPRVPASLRDVVLDCLHPTPTKRPHVDEIASVFTALRN